MKRIIYIFTLALALVACKKNIDDPTKSPLPEVKIDAKVVNALADPAGVSTRLTPAHGDQIAAFEPTDEVGIFIYDQPNAKFIHSNVKYTADAVLNFSTSPAIYYGSYGLHNAYAYYPYRAAVTDVTAIPLAVSLDQTAAGVYAKNDFLCDTVMHIKPQQITPTAPEIPMEFAHQMTSIVVKIRNADNSLLPEMPVIKIENTYTKSTFNAATQAHTGLTITAPLKNGRIADSVIMRRNPAGDEPATNTVCYDAIVMPQAVTAGTPLIFIQIGVGTTARTYEYTPAVNGPDLPRGLVQGAEHIFSLAIAGSELKVQGGEIMPWGKGTTVDGAIGGGGVSLARMIFELKTESGENEDAVAKITAASLMIDGATRDAAVTYIPSADGGVTPSRLLCRYDQGFDWGYYLRSFTFKDKDGNEILKNTAIALSPLRLVGNYIALTYNTPIATIKTSSGEVVN